VLQDVAAHRKEKKKITQKGQGNKASTLPQFKSILLMTSSIKLQTLKGNYKEIHPK